MSTSKLQRYISKQFHKRFAKYGLVENLRPHWLVSSKGEKLELDFFIDALSVAVEVQGKQHTRFIPFFHDTEYDFTEQLRRDAEKKDLCDKAGIHLFYIFSKPDVEIALHEIYTRIQERLNTQKDTWPDRNSRNIWAELQAIQEEKAIALQRKRYEKRLKKFAPAEQQAYFNKVVHRLKCSLDSTANVTPSENSKRKTRQKLRLIAYYADRDYITISDDQSDTILKARCSASINRPMENGP